MVPPSPRLPADEIRKTVLVPLFGVDEAMMKSGVADGKRRDPSTESLPEGVDVPMPKSPDDWLIASSSEESIVLGAL